MMLAAIFTLLLEMSCWPIFDIIQPTPYDAAAIDAFIFTPIAAIIASSYASLFPDAAIAG